MIGLDRLQRVADTIGAVVTLSTNFDAIDATTGRRPFSRLEGAELVELAVIVPSVDAALTRRGRLASGTLVGLAPLRDGFTIDEIAALLARSLADSVAELARPSRAHQALGVCWCGSAHSLREATVLNGGQS